MVPAPPLPTPGGHPLAGQGDRLLAKLLDGVVLIVPNLILLVLGMVPVAVLVVRAGPNENPTEDWTFWLVYLAGFQAALIGMIGVLYLYEVVYQHRTGQTVGKRVMRLRAVSLPDGNPPDRRQYRRRWAAENAILLIEAVPVLGLLIASVVGPYAYLNVLWCLWDKPYRQCLHDKYARTTVVKVPG